jgi:RES domain-containing protein
MPADESSLIEIFASLPTLTWHGHAWRHMFNDYPPQRINTSGARWNPPGVGAIYMALDRATALAEGQHAIEVQPRRTYARRVLYEVELSVRQLVDLTAPGSMQDVGLTVSESPTTIWPPVSRSAPQPAGSLAAASSSRARGHRGPTLWCSSIPRDPKIHW